MKKSIFHIKLFVSLKALLNRIKLLLVLWGVSLLLVSCLTENSEKAKNYATAYFDFFTYQGKDDFYEQNPLPTDDSYYNPILPGWYSYPSICSNDKDYFLVTSTFVYFPGVPIFHSTDLVNWKQIGNILDRPSQLINLEGQHTSGGIFAPSISYNPCNRTYYMITTNVGAGNFFVKTHDPFASWSEPIWLPTVHGIDPSFFFDNNGKAYILNNDEPLGGTTYDGHRAIKIREFDIVTEKVIGPEKILVNGGVNFEEKPIWIEGPHMYKINGYYYLISAEGGTGSNHSEVVLRGKEPMGEFVAYQKNPILTQRHLDTKRLNPVTCTGHADLVQDQKGDWWSVFLACRPINGDFENLGRETFLMPVRWTKDGFPFITESEELVPLIVRKEGTQRNIDAMFGNFSIKDSFDSEKLGLEWMTLRSPASEFYSLSDKKGNLSLKITEVSATEKSTPAFVCRRIQHHKFECTTKLKLENNNETDKAGILLYKDDSHQYFLAASADKTTMNFSLRRISEEGIQILTEKSIPNKNQEIHLKVDSQGSHFDFYYATSNNQWELLINNIDARYLSTVNSFGFTGTTIGMYATKK